MEPRSESSQRTSSSSQTSQRGVTRPFSSACVWIFVIFITIFAFCGCCGATVLLIPEDYLVDDSSDADSGEVTGDNTARVIEIVDGDTIKISYTVEVSSEGEDETTEETVVETVRLLGIDTPESVHPEKPVECFAEEATEYLRLLVEDRDVYYEFDETQDKRDKYDRLLLYIWRVDDDLFVNDELIRQGYAYEYTYDVPYEYQEQFQQAEVEARESGRGLWGEECGGER